MKKTERVPGSADDLVARLARSKVGRARCWVKQTKCASGAGRGKRDGIADIHDSFTDQINLFD
jgi:hypothetical protein